MIEFLWDSAKLKEYFLLTDKNKEVASEHLELCLKTTMTENGKLEYVVLDLQIKIITIYNYLWKVLCYDIDSKDNQQIHLHYRRKKRHSEANQGTPQ